MRGNVITQASEKMKVLDLACGKGAVNVQVAKALGCMVKGIDIIPEFIDFAIKKAQEYGVERLCEFMIGDINEAVIVEKDYDIVLLGAVGDVIGNPEETIQKIKDTVKNGGYIFIDDAYGSVCSDGRYPTREKWLLFFKNAGVVLIDEKLNEEEELKSVNDEQQSFIVKRANELKEKHPEKAYLFEIYIYMKFTFFFFKFYLSKLNCDAREGTLRCSFSFFYHRRIKKAHSRFAIGT